MTILRPVSDVLLNIGSNSDTTNSYGNNIANIGSVANLTCGKFLL
jgi:hypothetical protein